MIGLLERPLSWHPQRNRWGLRPARCRPRVRLGSGSGRRQARGRGHAVAWRHGRGGPPGAVALATGGRR
eukprot:6801783-Pyramimonas_sp.AAC.1